MPAAPSEPPDSIRAQAWTRVLLDRHGVLTVEGFVASQFAHPAAVERLRDAAVDGGSRLVAALDPANPYGAALAFPLAGPSLEAAMASLATLLRAPAPYRGRRLAVETYADAPAGHGAATAALAAAGFEESGTGMVPWPSRVRADTIEE